MDARTIGRAHPALSIIVAVLSSIYPSTAYGSGFLIDHCGNTNRLSEIPARSSIAPLGTPMGLTRSAQTGDSVRSLALALGSVDPDIWKITLKERKIVWTVYQSIRGVQHGH